MVAVRELSKCSIRRERQAERGSRACSLIACVALLLALASQPVHAQEPVYDIDISAQSAADALNELAEQTGSVILFPYDRVVERQANAVLGLFTLSGALEALLEGSGLTGGLSDRRIVQINFDESDVVERTEASTEVAITQGVDEMPNDSSNSFFRRLTTTLGLAATAATAAVPGQAQAQVSTAASATTVLEEVVVTARRRQELLVDVPVSITVMDSNFIQQNNILDTFALYAETPGVDYEVIGGRTNAMTTIRGVSPGTQSSINQKVTVLIDGVPAVGSNGMFQFIDLERVEVLRGPQSSAFGRSTFSGAINYVTRDPGDEFSANFQVGGSDLGRDVLSASFDGPITDTLGFTVDVFEEDFEGPDEWVTQNGRSLGGTNTQHASAKLKFTPNDFFDMELSASYTEQDDQNFLEFMLPRGTATDCNNVVLGNMKRHLQGEWNCGQETGPAYRYFDLTQDGFVEGTTSYLQALSFSVLEPTNTRERQRFAGEFNFNFDNGSLLQVIASTAEDEAFAWGANTSVVGASTNVMGMFNPMLTGGMGVPSGSDTEEYLDVRWLSPDDSQLRWMVGVSSFEFHYDTTVISQYAGIYDPSLGLEDLINGGMAFLPRRRSDQTAEAIGVYGSVAYDISDRTTVSLEARFQREGQTALDVLSGNTVDLETESFQPRFAINHALSDSWNVYGQISQGTNPARGNPQMIDPVVQAATEAAFAAGAITYTADQFTKTEEEELTNYEIGIKGAALDGRLQLAAALYIIDWDQMILGQVYNFGGRNPVMGSCAGVPGCWNDGSFDPNGVIYNPRVTNIRGSAINAGTGDLEGIELEANFRATDRWSFRGSLALQSSQYGDYCDFDSVSTYGFTSDCTDQAGLPGVQVGGNSIEENAEVQGTLSTTYVAPLGGTWQWTGHLGLRHTGARYIERINYGEIPAVTTANGQLGLRNDNWNIYLYGNNLTDEDTVQVAREFPEIALGGDPFSWRYIPRLPRELGVRVNFSF